MAYISAEQVKEIRTAIKKELPQFKISVRRDHHSGVIATLQSGPVDFAETYQQVNTYYISEHWANNPAACSVLEKIQTLMSGVRQQEFRDTGDYGSQPDYYQYIHIGAWDKPYSIQQ